MNATMIPLYGYNITGGKAYDLLQAFVIDGRYIYTSKERKPYSGSFGIQEKLDVSFPVNMMKIHHMEACQLDNDFALFVVSETYDNVYFLTLRFGGETNDRIIPVAWGSGIFAFEGTSRDNLKVHQMSSVDGDVYYTYMSVSDEKLHRYKVSLTDSGEQPLEVAQVDGQIFLLSSLDRLYRLELKGEECTAVFVKSYQGVSSLSMQKDTKYIHASMLDGQNQLIHTFLTSDTSGDDSGFVIPLDRNVSALVMSGYENTATVYYFSTQTNQLVRMSYDAESDNWNDLDIDIPEPNEVMRLPCYSTEITLLDTAYGTPVVDTELEIWTEQRCSIQTSDGIKVCDAQHKLKLSTDVQGKICVAQYTNKIDVPVIYASLPTELMADDECLAIGQYEVVTDRMSRLTSDELMSARMTDSMSGDKGYLIPDDKRNKENTDALNQSIHQVMNINQSMMNSNPYAKGVYVIKKDEIGTLKTLHVSNDMPAWKLSVDGDSIRYSDMSHEEFDSYLASVKASEAWLSEAEFKSIFSKIGDFFRSVAKKIVQVVEVVVKGVETVVTFVLDGVKRIYNFVTKTIGEILDFVETIFAVVAVFFVSVFAWIASLFMWNDVKLTERLIKGLLEETIKTVPAGVTKLKNIAGKYITMMEDKVDETIDKVCNTISPDTSAMEYAKKNQPDNPEAEEACSNNQLLNKLTASQSVTAKAVLVGDVATYDLGSTMDILEKYMDSITHSDGWSSLKTELEEVFSSMENIFTKLTVSLLKLCKACIHAALDGLEEVVDALCDVMNHLVEEFYGIITKQIDVPFFTKLYRLMTQDDLTILNLISYICAVSASLIYKLLGKKLPYDNEAQVDELVSNLTKRFVWVDNGESDEDNEGVAVNDSLADDILQYISTAVGTAYYILNAITDNNTRKNNLTDDEKISLMDTVIMVLEIIWLMLSIPSIYSGIPNDYTKDLWYLFLAGTALDFYVLMRMQKNIDRINDGRRYSSGYGVLHMIAAAIALGLDTKNFLSYIPELVGGASEATKFCLNTGNGKLGYFTVVCDGLAAGAVFACGLVSALSVGGEKEILIGG
jgi:hypothetical protein